MDDKAKDFVECLFFDILGWFIDLHGPNLDLPEKIEPKRCVPVDFHQKLLEVIKEILDELIVELENLPVLLSWSNDLFKRFTNSVCLMIIDNVDPEVDFLNVMIFMILIIYTSIKHNCYRWLDEIPEILETLLKERIQTKFYEENRFDAILEKWQMLKDEEEWCESTLEDVQYVINDSFATELAATERPLHDELFGKRIRIPMKDVKSHEETLRSNEEMCPFCDTNCISFLRALFEPRIVE